jgi:hypothetical protein
VLWQLANNALGKAPPSLPPALVNAAGSITSGKCEAAEAINAYFINKVVTLRAAALADPMRNLANLASESVNMASDISHPATETANSASNAANGATDVADLARETAKPEVKKNFEFTFATAGQIAKIIRGLKSTEAMGMDNIPTSILKKRVEVLAGPISHLVNRPLAKGRVPKAFKVGKVFPYTKARESCARTQPPTDPCRSCR